VKAGHTAKANDVKNFALALGHDLQRTWRIKKKRKEKKPIELMV